MKQIEVVAALIIKDNKIFAPKEKIKEKSQRNGNSLEEKLNLAKLIKKHYSERYLKSFQFELKLVIF